MTPRLPSAPSGPGSGPAAPGLPVRTLLLAGRVRVLVGASLVVTSVSAAAAWAQGGGLTTPGAAVLAAHLAVQAGVAVPVHWQFAGDPARRQRRAVRAMTVAFAVLAVLAALDVVRTLVGPGVLVVGAGPAGPVAAAGVGLALAAAVALPLLVLRDARVAERLGDRVAAHPWPAVVGAEVLLVGGLVGDRPTAAVWAVLAAAAAAQALRAWRGDGAR